MNFLFNNSFLFSRSVSPFSNCLKIKSYLVDCSVIRENSPSEHSFSIFKKFKQITSDLLFTRGTTVAELTGNKSLSQLHISGSLTCLIPVEKLYYSAGYDACCCHCGSKRKPITDINCYPICSLRKCESNKQMTKPKKIIQL